MNNDFKVHKQLSCCQSRVPQISLHLQLSINNLVKQNFASNSFSSLQISYNTTKISILLAAKIIFSVHGVLGFWGLVDFLDAQIDVKPIFKRCFCEFC